jgi:hypothetical protein
VLTSCIHTHAGPSTLEGGHLLGWITPAGYAETLVERCVAAALASRAGAEPATLRAGRWPLPEGLSINRRGLPYDPTFAVVDVIGRSGTRVGTVANVAIHPVALGPECLAVSSDWVGPFRTELERRAGGRAILLSGAIGDVNPCHVHRQENDCGGDGFAEAERLGRDVAQCVDAVLREAEPLPVDGPKVVRHRVVDVTLGTTMLTARRERFRSSSSSGRSAPFGSCRSRARRSTRSGAPSKLAPATKRLCSWPASHPNGTAISPHRSATATKRRRATARARSPRSPTH